MYLIFKTLPLEAEFCFVLKINGADKYLFEARLFKEEEGMDREFVERVLTQYAESEGATPTKLREHARRVLNGSMQGHPLLVHACGKPTMRIETEENTFFIKVPVPWMKQEP